MEHQVAIVLDVPCASMVFDAVVFEEGLGLGCPEKKHEIVVDVPNRKCMRNESVDEEMQSE